MYFNAISIDFYAVKCLIFAFILCNFHVYKWEEAYTYKRLNVWRILMKFLCIYLGEGRGGVWCTNACIYMYMETHIVSLYYRSAWLMFMKLGNDEVLMARTCAFYQIHAGVDPRQGKKVSKRPSKTKGFTCNAAILVVVWPGIPRLNPGQAKIGRGGASHLTRASFRPNVHSSILMYCQWHMHLFESCHSGCLFSDWTVCC